MASPPLSPHDFDFASFNPNLPTLFPNPPALPASAELFSSAETDHLLGFLDNFNDAAWGLTPDSQPYDVYDALAPYSNPHLNTTPRPSTSAFGVPSESPPSISFSPSAGTKNANASRSKALLSTPQKRLNHIMSEQKRRNAIRDGYAQLITLLAPTGSTPALSMPTRGRPKGSGSRGKGQSKGKSGVLFRAVEYCRWLEEGRDALREEVLRVEAAAAGRH
ncbi:hypothetical protein AGABI2DRAFT_114029 [Agaricus bisporus var. bisporus H97]|uniref:hypothetical protein n=1 Tax=Agaricus bisporus var. bisporus (strain H97 / ATCC MYA-4626 / FGSC 10389) TaxID=936046 RepID=UPI00029F5AD0|nr:hypothetical protein AGABI2DRAFT_114029 [Agaricus bisporus var. bisporus H97]EKV51295.1 hypothetical protein AGABI2DRAFT_114029 [Agaricus bisporus var. bisporus H97]